MWITIEEFMSERKDRLDSVHPGDVLREDFMKPLGLSAYAVAKAIGAKTAQPSSREWGRRGLSPDIR